MTNPLAQLFRDRRLELGLTQVEVARRSEVTSPHVHDMETGRRYPSAPVLDRLAAALEIPHDVLFRSDPRQALAAVRRAIERGDVTPGDVLDWIASRS